MKIHEYSEPVALAKDILRHCAHPMGFKASAFSGVGERQRHGYPQVWARDSMITSLGALIDDEMGLARSVRGSIATLRKGQSKFGCIPNNVHTKSKRVDFRAYADGTAWFVLGVANLWEQSGDDSVVRENWTAVKEALTWYAYQDVDASGLVSIHESSDWEDLFAIRGKGLYVNLLVMFAHRKASKMARRMRDGKRARSYAKTARSMGRKINEKLWYDKSRNTPRGIFHFISDYFEDYDAEELYYRRRGHDINLPKKTVLKNDGYYLPYLSFQHFGEWFDAFGNMLAILTGIADEKRTEAILKTVKRHRIASPHPIKATWPPQKPGDRDWRYYYLRTGVNLNDTDKYHNGGIWPFLGGFYVAALVKAKRYQDAEKAFASLAEANMKGRFGTWEFNEWLHGKTGTPTGMAEQAWSAGMFLFAEECVRTRRVPFF